MYVGKNTIENVAFVFNSLASAVTDVPKKAEKALGLVQQWYNDGRSGKVDMANGNYGLSGNVLEDTATSIGQLVGIFSQSQAGLSSGPKRLDDPVDRSSMPSAPAYSPPLKLGR